MKLWLNSQNYGTYNLRVWGQSIQKVASNRYTFLYIHKQNNIFIFTEMTTLHRSSSQGSLGSNPPPDVPPRPRPISTHSDIIQTRISSAEALNMSSSPGRINSELGIKDDQLHPLQLLIISFCPD